ncbi:MAG: hypothetical protein RL223_3230 [Pseudomonadota bacterium]|jgi:outer membrane protein OmpU
MHPLRFPRALRRSLPTLAVAASFAAAGVHPALAADEFSIYGAIDVGVTWVSDEGGRSNLLLDDSVSVGNRLGFKGSRTLADGLKAAFVLENGFRLDNGGVRQGGALFGRQALLALSGGFGTVSAGLQYDFIADHTSEFNISGYASGYAVHLGDVDRMGMNRLKNTLKYLSPDLGGLQAGLMVSLGEQAGSRSAGGAWSGGLHYAQGPLVAGLAVTHLKQPTLYAYDALGVSSLLGQATAAGSALALDSQTATTAGLSWTVNERLTLIGSASHTRLSAGGRSEALKVLEAGGTWQLAPGLQAQAGWQHSRLDGHHWNQLSAGLSRELDPRTAIYASVDRLQASAGVDAVIGYSFVPADGGRQTVLRTGVRHKF